MKSEKGIEKTNRKKILAAVALLFALLIVKQQTTESFNQEFLQRKEPGEGNRQESLEAIVDGKSYDVNVEIAERQFTKKEAKNELKAARKEIDETFIGNNQSINCIKKPVVMKSSYQNGNVEAEWRLDSYEVINAEGEFVKKRTAKKRCVDRSLCGIKLWRRERRILFWISCIFSGFECQRTDRDSIGKAKPEGQNKKEFYSSEKTRKKRNSMEGKEFAYGRNIAAARSCHRNTLKISWNRRRTKEKEKAGRGTAIILPTIGYHLGFADWSWDAGIQGMGENGKPLQERGYGKECSI